MLFNRQTLCMLIVGDQSADLQFLTKILYDAEWHSIIAVCEEEALIQAQVYKPNLVLLKITMPTKDSFRICKVLHRLPDLSDLPIIVITPLMDRSYQMDAFNAGAVDYIFEPLIPDEFLARIRVHIELKEARNHLSRILHEREEISNIVAHDLKNPLTCILFATQLMKRNDLTTTKRKELLQDISICVEEALQFLNQAEKVQHLRQDHRIKIDLKKLANEVIQLQRAAADTHHVSLHLKGENAIVYANPITTRYIIHCLISNAIIRSPDKGEVIIVVRYSLGGYGQCLVTDWGPIFSKLEQSKLLKRFLHLTTKGIDISSSVLDLAIAKKNAFQMGGHMWYENYPRGANAFGFELPY